MGAEQAQNVRWAGNRIKLEAMEWVQENEGSLAASQKIPDTHANTYTKGIENK